METPVRHIHHTQTIFTATINALSHHHDLVKGDRYSTFVPEKNHTACVRDTENIDSQSVGNDCTAVVVDCHLDDLLALSHFAFQLVYRDLSSGLGVSHC